MTKDGKFTDAEARAYWTRTHREAANDLQAVCSPVASVRRNRFFDEIQRSAIVRALDENGLAGPHAKVLEIGCGRGRWLMLFRQRGAMAIGIDLSADAVERCRAQGLEALVASADHIPFADASFDLVVAITVMIHLPPDAQARAAHEMRRVCRPGGRILLLEGVKPTDKARHVWARRVADWVGLFPQTRLLFVESHYYVPLIRAVARVPVNRLPAPVRNALELIVIGISRSIERILMRRSHGRRSSGALQALVILEPTIDRFCLPTPQELAQRDWTDPRVRSRRARHPAWKTP